MTDPSPDARASATPAPFDRPGTGDARVTRVRRIALSEDWAATLVGLAIIAVVLVGLWPDWLVP